MHVKIIGIAAGIAAILYLTYRAATRPVTAIAVNANTQLPPPPMSTLFSSPSPVVPRSTLQTNPGTFVANGLPLTSPSPSLLVPLYGDPGVGTGGVSGLNPGLDYPGIQTYMIDPNAPDPNSVLA
jgi:hypothetical protein